MSAKPTAFSPCARTLSTHRTRPDRPDAPKRRRCCALSHACASTGRLLPTRPLWLERTPSRPASGLLACIRRGQGRGNRRAVAAGALLTPSPPNTPMGPPRRAEIQLIPSRLLPTTKATRERTRALAVVSSKPLSFGVCESPMLDGLSSGWSGRDSSPAHA